MYSFTAIDEVSENIKGELGASLKKDSTKKGIACNAFDKTRVSKLFYGQYNKFLITTNYALFFNVLFNAREKNWDRKTYVLCKSGAEIHLKPRVNDLPFAYHRVIISEIAETIASNNFKKYHFRLFKRSFRKTANFLGYLGARKNFYQKIIRKDFERALCSFI